MGPLKSGSTPQEQVEELRQWCTMLARELDVLLKNLDEDNVNPQALERLRELAGREG